jgi:Chalcone isomerase-like
MYNFAAKKHRIQIFQLICSLLALHLTSHVFAQTQASTPTTRASAAQSKTKSENFPKQIQVEGVKLNLNGQGTRYKAIFRVYDMGLYTTAKATTLQEVINAPGPKKLEFVALRELSTTDIGQLFYKGIKENNSAALYLKHATSALQLSEIASARSKIMPGESFSIEFVPGKGMTFYVMDKPQGAAIGDAEFFVMVLGIWLGPAPVDFMLKDALLGIAK